MGRWDFLYELQPRSALDVLLDKAADALAEDLRSWPPPLEGVEPHLDARLREVLRGERPHRLAYREAFRLVRWDMEHAYEAIDRWQDDGWREAGIGEADCDAALFLWRYLAERLFDLGEATEGRLKRRDLIELSDRIERRFLAPSLLA